MIYNPEIHHRRSMRLKDYDYSQTGAYFVTICSWNRECLFGKIIDGNMQLDEFGQIVQENWTWLSHHKYVHLDEWSVMPNHLHGIVVINDDGRGGFVGAIHELPLQNKSAIENKKYRRQMLLPKIIGRFKMNAAKQINKMRNTQGVPVWQRNYYEHIIRNEDEFNRIQEYIINNPLQWAEDENNPMNLKGLEYGG